jgi:radical SAM superfamily enzyme YgiQ (UPF0313 family)
MDILLIDPPYISLKGIATDCGYNIGLTSLAAYLRRDGIEAAVLSGDLLAEELTPSSTWTDLEVYAAGQRKYEKIVNDKSHIVWKKLVAFVRQTQPTAVGIQYYTPSKYSVERIAGLIREINPDIKIIVGAFHPTFCPEEVMVNHDIDFAIRGEGEIPLLRLVQELKKAKPKWETVPGIHYRDQNGRVLSNPGVSLIDNLDELPFPARDIVLNCDYNIYRDHCICTARGCPYTCSFCGDKRLWGGKVRRRSVESVIKELKLLKDTYTVNTVDIVDGTFTFDRKYLVAFCNALIDQRLGLNWRCTARYDTIDEEVLNLMKRANCSGLYFGLESGNDKVLKAIDKKTTTEQIVRKSEIAYDSGIFIATSIIMGLPYETKEDMEETLKFVKRIKTSILDVNNYTPLPGTPLWDTLSEDDKKKIDWRKVGLKSVDNYFSKLISPDDLKKCLAEAYTIARNVQSQTLVRYSAGNNLSQ